MSDILSGTPRSNAEPGGRSRTPATKNRSCPFCYAPFTSSSLGRHLDLYIKERNPKPPDDVHDVEEIRRLRGGVTRRQPRTSSAKREDSTHSSSKPTPTRDQRSPSVPARFAGPGLVNGASTKSPFNRSQWEAAAAANDLPPRLNSGEPLSQLAKRRNTTRGASLKEDFGRKQDAQEERDRGRAAELALKELLENVKAATLRAQPRDLFDFNWFSQSFPAICLRCLSAPPQFMSTSPNPGQPSWPVETPGADQLRHLETWLRLRLDGWKQRRHPSDGDDRHNMNGINSDATHHRPTQDIDREKQYTNHLLTAYQIWESLSGEQKRESWHLECQRAFTREQEAHKATNARLERVEQQLHQLQLHQMQAPLDERRGYRQVLEPSPLQPSTMLLSHEVLDELNNHRAVPDWDHESAILKWKTRIQNERSTQQPLPNVSASNILWPQIFDAKSHTNGVAPPAQARRGDQRVHHNDGPDIDHELPNMNDNDEDLVDAPGDDDDEGSVQCHPMADRVIDDRVLDPELGVHLDTVMKEPNSNSK